MPVRTQKCVDCGAPAEMYDHRSLSKPEDVEPVCRRHNILRGPADSVSIGLQGGDPNTHTAGHLHARRATATRVVPTLVKIESGTPIT